MHPKDQNTRLEVLPQSQEDIVLGHSYSSQDSSNDVGHQVVLDDYPDGGLRAWAVVLGSWCALVPAFGIVNTIGVLQDWLAEHQLSQYPKSTVSWIFSLWIFFFYVGGVQVGMFLVYPSALYTNAYRWEGHVLIRSGPIFDAHGLKYLVVPGSAGLVASLVIMSVSTELYQFILGFSVLGGITASMLFTPSLAVINHWFLDRRGLATGFAMTAGSIGGIVFPLLVGDLSKQIGFPWAIRVMALLCLAFCAISALLIRTRLPPNKEGGSTIDLRALCDPRLLHVAIATILVEIGFLIPMTYLVSYASSHDVSSGLSFQLMAILNAASIFGRVIPGYIADQWGRFNVVIVTNIVCTILILSLWLKSGYSAPAIICFSAFFGFWSGTAMSLSPVCVAQISKTEEYGKRYGTTYSLVGFATLVAIPVAGEIIKVQNKNGPEKDYSGLIIFGGVAYGLSAVFYLIAKGVSTKWNLKEIF